MSSLGQLKQLTELLSLAKRVKTHQSFNMTVGIITLLNGPSFKNADLLGAKCLLKNLGIHAQNDSRHLRLRITYNKTG